MSEERGGREQKGAAECGGKEVRKETEVRFIIRNSTPSREREEGGKYRRDETEGTNRVSCEIGSRVINETREEIEKRSRGEIIIESTQRAKRIIGKWK